VTHLAGLNPAWINNLPAWRADLVERSRKSPGEWHWRELPIGWRFNVMLATKEPVAGRFCYRFRSPQYPGVTWHDFREQAHQLLVVLGAGHWREQVQVRRVFWEVTYIAPETPAPPREAA
jgi:hypothetical protein